MPKRPSRFSRRSFIARSAGVAAAGSIFHIVPRHVLGGPDNVPPSDTLNGALIGVGGRGPGTFKGMAEQFKPLGKQVNKVVECDVRFVESADNKTRYTDFRRVLERKDIDLIAIGTPPHWHALISIAAAEAGKDVLCEKPMTRTIGEGRAVVEAFRRFDRVFQIGTFGRFSASKDKNKVLTHKIMRSGLLKNCQAVDLKKGGLKVKEWSGRPELKVDPTPTSLDWDMYCGPRPLVPFVRPRFGGTHRQYWDYEGGGLSDMGQHYYDPTQWTYGKDDTSPVQIEAYAPPAHPEVTGSWAWIELTYADGLTFAIESGEWGEPYTRKKARDVKLTDLSPEDQEKIKVMPDPEPLLTFAEAVLQRKQAGGHAEAAHRAATIVNLSNIAIRMGRKLKYDPVKEQIIGDEEANRLINQPMRAPWHV